MSALLLVDIQYDFLELPDSKGSLAVQDSASILPHVYRLIESDKWDLIVASQDYHPPNHISFASRHPDQKPFTSIKVKKPPSYSEEHTQELWPDHCVQSTKGSEIETGVQERAVKKNGIIVKKGVDIDLDAYSAFSKSLNEQDQLSSPLTKILRDAKIKTLVVVGLATDYCVKASVSSALELEFLKEIIVVKEGVKGVDPENSEKVLTELEKRGVKVWGIEEMMKKAVELRDP